MGYTLLNEIRELPSLSQQEKHLLMVICDYADDKTCCCYASLATLASNTRISRRNVCRLLRKLADFNLITVIHRVGANKCNKSNIYQVNLKTILEMKSGGALRVSPPKPEVIDNKDKDQGGALRVSLGGCSQGVTRGALRVSPRSLRRDKDKDIDFSLREKDKEKSCPVSAKNNIAPCPHREIVDLYHEILPELTHVQFTRWQGSKREEALRTRWKEHKTHRTLDFWKLFFATVRTNGHWLGENNRGWTADLGWLLKRENFDKVIDRIKL